MASRKRVAGALLALLGVGALPSRALGQEADTHARAVRLFEEAGRAQDRHAYDEACPMFAKVVELEPEKVGAKLALADCYEQAGKLASAVAAYRAAGVRAAETGDPRKKRSDAKVAELETRAPRVAIQVSEALRSLPGLTILRDGAPLSVSQWNQALLSDPGEHTIYVAAPGKRPWSGKVTVIVGTVAQIVIAGLEDLAPPAPAVTLDPPSSGYRAPPARSPRVPVWAWVTTGLGVASGDVAFAFVADQAAAQRDFDVHCKNFPRDQVTCSGLSARLYRDFGLWIGLGTAGVVAVTAATIGIGIAGSKHPRAPAGASLWIAPLGTGAALGGRF